MHPETRRFPGLVRLLASLALIAFATAPAPGDGAARGMSRDQFDVLKNEIAAGSAERKAGDVLRRLSLLERRDALWVEDAVRRRTDEGKSEGEALDDVVGAGRVERVAKARRRLLEVHIPNERARESLLGNFRAVRDAMAGAGIAPGGVRAAIPMIESAYDPMAFNVAHRLGGETVKGMWQFTETTGREYGLEVTKRGRGEADADPDQRYDPARSSAAARAYLDALNAFDFAEGCPATEELVLASYHMGQGNANRKIAQYGCDFWQWRRDGEHGFGTHSYNYPALVLAGRDLMSELRAAR